MEPTVSQLAQLVLLAQQEDLKRDAGLRGEEWVRAAWQLGLVFLAALVVLVVVLWMGRRRVRRGGPSGDRDRLGGAGRGGSDREEGQDAGTPDDTGRRDG